jgi:hypothetical protein
VAYAVNVEGHVEGATAEESKAREQAIIDAAKAFVRSLDGVVNANGSFAHHGSVPLHEPAPAAAEPEPDEAAPPASG